MPEVVGTLKLPRLATAPGSPAAGQMYHDTATGYVYYWNGTVWLKVVSTEVWVGTAAPSPRNDYTLWIDTT